MQTKTLLLVAAAAASASAQGLAGLHPGHVAAKRDLVARATPTGGSGGGDTTCATALLSVYSSLPTLPADLMSYEQSNLPTGAACSYTFPGSLSAEFSAYESTFMSWYTAHASQLSSALSQCPQYESLTSQYAGGYSCTATDGSAGNPTASAVGPASTDSGSGSSSGSSSGSGTGSNGGVTVSAGSREAGFVAAAAVAVAGILGAIVAL